MKRALVISGGGSKGAFAAGVLQQLKIVYPELTFDIIVGTSTGALITPLATLEELTLLEQLYTTTTTNNVVTKHRIGDRLNEKSVYTVEPLWNLIKNTLTNNRYTAILQSGKKVYITTTCLQTSGIVVYTTDTAPKPSKLYLIKKLADAEHMRLAVLASTCIPVLMTPVKIDAAYAAGKEKAYQYVDGGVREYAGIQMAIDQGATEVFAILLSSKGEAVQEVEYKTLFPILERTIDIFSEDVEKNDVAVPEVYAAALRYIQAVKRKMEQAGIPKAQIENYFTIDGQSNPFETRTPVTIYIIRPDAPLGGGPGGLVFNPVEMRKMVETGKRQAQQFAATIKPGEATWLAGNKV